MDIIELAKAFTMLCVLMALWVYFKNKLIGK